MREMIDDDPILVVLVFSSMRDCGERLDWGWRV